MYTQYTHIHINHPPCMASSAPSPAWMVSPSVPAREPFCAPRARGLVYLSLSLSLYIYIYIHIYIYIYI